MPQKEQKLSQNGEKALKDILGKLYLKIDKIQKKKLNEFTNEYSEKIGTKIDKTQFNVINQNLGVKLNIKNYSQFKKEGKVDLYNILEIKSIKYSKINFAKKIYEKAALKFKNLFHDSIYEIIDNEQRINELIKNIKIIIFLKILQVKLII